MDKSLDDIIKSKPRNHRRGGARVNALGTSAAGANPSTRARYAGAVPLANGASAVTPATQASDKIIVSNLPLDVNEAQIKELFSSTVGNLRDVNLHYDAHGKSKGVALVQFVKKGDGAKAYQQYNNRLIDGS
ncbi:hypothetical protein SISSUDRAFT_987590 [Sistotremastrum suecicum HHB10207 ss-3]|uniref:RRM domain-containing protein n=1 Tax=Sistotremastrum suecicum HHB10207 ss-3 TaxID=1314776 RepID=A0A166CI90_9AGAM|nr:hypothetical protein SISSUDRAFT_987590 [Sistotremastrum suecicum HHB10207 ss-3]